MNKSECSLRNYHSLKGTSVFHAFVMDCNDKFELTRLFTHFQHRFKESFELLLAASLLLGFFCFLNIKYIADKFLSNSIVRTQHRLRISPLVSALTLIPIANGAPDLIASYVFSSKNGGEAVAFGSLVSAFIFASTVIFAYIFWVSGQPLLEVPGSLLMKDHLFYALGLATAAFFGWVVTVQDFFYLLPVALTVLYVLVSVYLGQRVEKKMPVCAQELSESTLSQPYAFTTLGGFLRDHLWDPDHPLISVLLLPSRAWYLASVPYEENPLMHTPAKYLVVWLSLTAVQLFLQVSEEIPVVLVVSTTATLLLLAAFRFRLVWHRRTLVYDLLTLLAAVAWIKLLSTLLLESIVFVSFVASIGEVYLSIVVLSIGNSISDLFSNGAIAASGHALMALLGTYSSQIFNLFIGTSIYLAFGKSRRYDLFDLESGERGGQSEMVKLLIVLALGCLALNIAQLAFYKGYTHGFVVFSAFFYILFLFVTAFLSFFGS